MTESKDNHDVSLSGKLREIFVNPETGEITNKAFHYACPICKAHYWMKEKSDSHTCDRNHGKGNYLIEYVGEKEFFLQA